MRQQRLASPRGVYGTSAPSSTTNVHARQPRVVAHRPQQSAGPAACWQAPSCAEGLRSLESGSLQRRVAQEALEQRWHVSGSCRSAEKAAGFRRTGIDAFTFDLDESYSGLEAAGLEADLPTSDMVAYLREERGVSIPRGAVERSDLLSLLDLSLKGPAGFDPTAPLQEEEIKFMEDWEVWEVVPVARC